MEEFPDKQTPEIPLSLQEEYLNAAHERIKKLKRLSRDLRKQNDLELLRELRLEIDRVAGSAAIFGFPEISKICLPIFIILNEKITNFNEKDNYISAITFIELNIRQIEMIFLTNETYRNG